MNLRPSGYEPDELPGCSTPRHPRHHMRAENENAAASEGQQRRLTCEWLYFRPNASCKAWRRPTLPQLKLKYHWRSPVSRPSSRWDRVGHGRYGHQAMEPANWVFNRCSCFVMSVWPDDLPTTTAGLSLMVQIHQARTELLGPVSSIHYCTSTPGLSTSWSTTVR